MSQNTVKIVYLVQMLLALTVGVLYLTGAVSGLAAVVLTLVAGVFPATGFTVSSPAYSQCIISTRK